MIKKVYDSITFYRSSLRSIESSQNHDSDTDSWKSRKSLSGTTRRCQKHDFYQSKRCVVALLPSDDIECRCRQPDLVETFFWGQEVAAVGCHFPKGIGHPSCRSFPEGVRSLTTSGGIADWDQKMLSNWSKVLYHSPTVSVEGFWDCAVAIASHGQFPFRRR
jgi:hypothetical protein